MAFVQANLDYAAEYSRAMSNALPYLSYFPEIWGSTASTTYKPGMGKTVYIPSLTVSGAVAVNRDAITGAFARNFNNDLVAKTLDMDREWSTLVDPMDIEETNLVATIANVTKVFNETQKVPEMDAYIASKLYGFVTPDTTSLTAANILTTWDGYLASLENARVQRGRLVAYVTPATKALLKQASGVTRFVDVGAAGGINREVATLDGVPVKVVPADMMKSAYTFTEGWVAGNSAVQINLILCDPECVAAPVKYETAMMSAPTAQSKGKYLYYERYYYGAFVLPNRASGIIVNAAS